MNNRTRTLSQCRTALPRHIAMMESLEERQFLSAASAHQGWGSHRFNTLKTTAQVTTSSDLGTASSLTTADTPVGATIAAPAAPSNFQAIAINGQQVSLSWSDNANNETSFKIERARGTAGSWTQIAIVGSNITFYTDSGLSAATLYQYRICASNVAGSSAYSPSVTTTTSNSVPPAAPTNPMTIAATTSSITVKWADNSTTETGFEVERSAAGANQFSRIATTAANVSSYTDNGLSINTAYDYRVRAINANGGSVYTTLFAAKTDPSPRTFTVASGVPTVNGGNVFTVSDILVVPASNTSATPITLQAALVTVIRNDAATSTLVYQTPNREAIIRAVMSTQGDDQLFSITVTADAAWAIRSIQFGGPYIYTTPSSDLKIFNPFKGGSIQDWRQDVWTAEGTAAWPNNAYSPITAFFNQRTTEGVGFLSFDLGLEQRTIFWISGPAELHPYVRWECMIAPGASQDTTVQMHHAFNMPSNQFTFYHDNFLKPFMDSMGIGEGTVNISKVMVWSDGTMDGTIIPGATQAVQMGSNAYLQYAPGDGAAYFEPNPQTLWWYPSLNDASQLPGLDVLGVLIDPFMRSRATSPTTDTTSPLWFPDGGGPESLSDPTVQVFLNRLKNDLVAQGVNFAFWDLGSAAPAGEGKLWFNLLRTWKQAGISIAAESSCDLASYVTGTNLFFGFQEDFNYDLVRAVTPKAKVTVIDNRNMLPSGDYWWNKASALGFIPLLTLGQMDLWVTQHPAV